jgi:hypothetical protein
MLKSTYDRHKVATEISNLYRPLDVVHWSNNVGLEQKGKSGKKKIPKTKAV